MSSFDHINWFRASSPYINAYRDRTFVVYLPGEAIAHANFATIVQDLTLLHSLGIRLVLVHGSRPQIDHQLAQEQITTQIENGQRITDEAALASILRAVGTTRFTIEAALSTGLPNSPMHNADIRVVSGNFVVGMPKGVINGVDFHHTGNVRKIDSDAINAALDQGALVLVSHIGFSATGEMFNISSLSVAKYTAQTLNADKLITFIKASGLVQEGKLLRQISVSQCQEVLNSGELPESDTASALQASFEVCQQGVPRAQIISYQNNGALLEELFTVNGNGTLVHGDGYEVLRKATIADVGGILALLRPLEEKGTLVRRSRELLETEISQFTVLEIDSTIIGCAGLYAYGESDMAELAAVATHPNYQGKGLGAKLLAHVQLEARKQGYQSLFVLTTQTAHWFAEQGFEPGALDQLPQHKQALYNLQRRSKVFIKVLNQDS